MTDGIGPDQANRDVVERFFEASERGDGDVVAALVHDEMVMEWPQSGERFVGRANVLAAMGAVEVKPEFAGRATPHRFGQRLGADGPAPLWRGHPPVRCRAPAGRRQDQARHRLLGQPIPGTGIASALRRPRLSSGLGSTGAAQTPARVNVRCVTPLGADVASIS